MRKMTTNLLFQLLPVNFQKRNLIWPDIFAKLTARHINFTINDILYNNACSLKTKAFVFLSILQSITSSVHAVRGTQDPVS